jgi:hypothetical protein
MKPHPLDEASQGAKCQGTTLSRAARRIYE